MWVHDERIARVVVSHQKRVLESKKQGCEKMRDRGEKPHYLDPFAFRLLTLLDTIHCLSPPPSSSFLLLKPVPVCLRQSTSLPALSTLRVPVLFYWRLSLMQAVHSIVSWPDALLRPSMIPPLTTGWPHHDPADLILFVAWN